MIPHRLLRRYVYSLPILLVAIATLSSGCMWGVARDVDTGKPIVGAKVTLTDSHGQTLVATTDQRGIFGFGQPNGPAPALGQAQVKIEASGYDTLSETRQIDYADNPFATLADPSSFWDVQAFYMSRPGVLYHNASGKFSVPLPAGWDVQDNFFGEGSVRAVPPSDYAVFPADISVGGSDRPAGETLGAWVDDTENNVQNVVGDFQLLARSSATIAGLSAIRVIVSYTVTADSSVPGLYASGQQLQEEAYFLKDGNKGYILDFTATQANFPALQNRYEQIAQSFKFD